MTLRVGLDGRFAVARYDGVGRYVAELARGLLQLADPPRLRLVSPPADEQAHHRLPTGPGDVSTIAPRHAQRPESPWSLLEMPRLAGRAQVDVWHTPFPIAAPRLPVPSVVTVHDCIPERFAGYFGRVPRLAYRAAVATAVRSARLVIVPSELTAADVRRFHHAPASRLRMVPLGVAPAPVRDDPHEAALRRGLGLDAGYVLLVGRPRPHKGHATVVRALARLERGHRPQLVRVGRPDPRLPDGSAALAAQVGVALVELAGISDAELVAVYRGAGVVAIPSVVEGFGLPLLEALAAGAPVVASAIDPLQTGGGEVARYVDGDDTAWAEVLLEALDDHAWQRAVRDRGPEQAARFTWAAMAEQTRAVYAEAAA